MNTLDNHPKFIHPAEMEPCEGWARTYKLFTRTELQSIVKKRRYLIPDFSIIKNIGGNAAQTGTTRQNEARMIRVKRELEATASEYPMKMNGAALAKFPGFSSLRPHAI